MISKEEDTMLIDREERQRLGLDGYRCGFVAMRSLDSLLVHSFSDKVKDLGDRHVEGLNGCCLHSRSIHRTQHTHKVYLVF